MFAEFETKAEADKFLGLHSVQYQGQELFKESKSDYVEKSDVAAVITSSHIYLEKLILFGRKTSIVSPNLRGVYLRLCTICVYLCLCLAMEQ